MLQDSYTILLFGKKHFDKLGHADPALQDVMWYKCCFLLHAVRHASV
jgi:hypothetical protein